MKKITLIIFILIIKITGEAQALDSLPSGSQDFNLGMEMFQKGKNLPEGWFYFSMIKGYHARVDSNIRHNGRYSLMLSSDSGSTNPQFGTIAYSIPAKNLGRDIEISAFIRQQDVKSQAGLLLRVDDQNKILEYKSLFKGGIKGIKDWKLYTVKARLSQNAQNLFIGPILQGFGKIWIDDIQIWVDGKELKTMNRVKGYVPKIRAVNYGENTMNSRTIELKDTKIYMETYGSGEPLLLLHGNSQSIFAFAKQIPELSKSYKVIAIDTRGSGRSKDRSTGHLSYDLFAADLKSVMDSLGLKNVNLIGWSDGGNIALTMALKYPGYIGKMAIMDANLFPTTEAVEPGILKEVRQTLKELEKKSDQDSKLKARMYAMLLTEPRISFGSLKSIAIPVLVMAGEKDIILEKHTRGIAENIPNSLLWIFKDATHYAPVEQPNEFNRVVLSFFSEVVGYK